MREKGLGGAGGSPWRRRETPFGEGLNAAKPLLTRFCVAKSVTYPPNLPDPPRTSPKDPRHYASENLFRFCGGGGLWGKFLGWLGGWDLHLVMIFPNDKKTETDRKPFEGSVGSLGIRSFLQVSFLFRCEVGVRDQVNPCYSRCYGAWRDRKSGCRSTRQADRFRR